MKQYEIEKKDKKTGFMERIIYTGNLRNKPKGWKVVREVK